MGGAHISTTKYCYSDGNGLMFYSTAHFYTWPSLVTGLHGFDPSSCAGGGETHP